MPMSIRLWILAFVFTIIGGLNTTILLPAPDDEEVSCDHEKELDELGEYIAKVAKQSSLTAKEVNHLKVQLENMIGLSERGFEKFKDAEKGMKEIQETLDGTNQARADFVKQRRKQEREEKLEDERILMQDRVDKFKEILNDKKPLVNVAFAAIGIALFYYIIKHGVPILMHRFTQPKVISETSRAGWFSWDKKEPSINMNELVFTPLLQKQLADLLLRIQTAKQYNENLPNLLFFGTPGTGKTAFAKALAYESGLDYAITSGSEFAKITDLRLANDELRKLLDWAKNTKRGLVVFIDEAESLFVSRKFSTTPKATQDFINTFLALISDQSQKNVMFILATNHPFKLDESITSRIGVNVEFVLPGEDEREMILVQYLAKFAQENDGAIVEIHPEIKQNLTKYAQELDGFSPRAIKFVAEDMIVKARRQGARLLTNNIARLALDQAKQNLQQDQLREKDREEWLSSLSAY